MQDTETDIDDILMDLPFNGGGRAGNGEGGADAEDNNGRMLGRLEDRPLKRAGSILDVAKSVRSYWIPYCNNVCLCPSGESYTKFSKLYRKSSSLPSELADGMKMCADIREGSIRAFLKVRETIPDFRFFNDPLDKLIADIVNVDGSTYRGSKEKQVCLFREIKEELDRMGEAADGLMFGSKDEIVSWWRGTVGSSVCFYEERNWGYAFYLMCALCDDNGEEDPVARTLLEAIESSYKDSSELCSLWENMFVFLLLVFGMVLDTPIATDNEMIRKFGRNVLHTKGKLSKKGGKNSLNSPNGLRVLSCSSKVAFFLDVAAKQDGFLKTIGMDPNVQKTHKLVKDKSFKEVGKKLADDVYLWLFWQISRDYRPRQLAAHLGLDVLFYVCMCICTSDSNGNQEYLCRYKVPADSSKDKRMCVSERYAKARSIGLSEHTSAEAIRQGLTEQVKRLISLLEDTFGLPEEKREVYAAKKEEIFKEMICPIGGNSLTIAWNAGGLPAGFSAEQDFSLSVRGIRRSRRADRKYVEAKAKKRVTEADLDEDDGLRRGGNEEEDGREKVEEGGMNDEGDEIDERNEGDEAEKEEDGQDDWLDEDDEEEDGDEEYNDDDDDDEEDDDEKAGEADEGEGSYVEEEIGIADDGGTWMSDESLSEEMHSDDRVIVGQDVQSKQLTGERTCSATTRASGRRLSPRPNKKRKSNSPAKVSS